jgi:hypothetical protein
MSYTTEEILWLAIKDIENGTAKTLDEDPINGLLTKNKKLSKVNVSLQSAKYNDGKAITRPTIDTYEAICDYIDGKSSRNDTRLLKDEIKKLKEKNKQLEEIIIETSELNKKLALENRQMKELVKKEIK